jgi:hypothetical protein
MKGALAYIRTHYGVPARRGGRIRYEGKLGTITGADTDLIVKPDERYYDSTRWYCHPTWHIEYLDKQGRVIWRAKEATA